VSESGPDEYADPYREAKLGLASFVISFLLCAAGAAAISARTCPHRFGGITALIDAGFAAPKDVLGGLFLGAVLIATIVYDLIGAGRFLIGYDKTFQDLVVRPGMYGKSQPLPRASKFLILPIFWVAGFYIIVHEIPRCVCDLIRQ
jgi:hypothetical protein